MTQRDASPAAKPNPALDLAEKELTHGEELFTQGRVQEAIDAFQQALSADPRSARARNDLGVVLHALGDAEGALALFDEVLALVPNDATALVNKARILVSVQRTIEAAACVRAVLRANPLDVDGNELLAELDLPRPGRVTRRVQPIDDAELTSALRAAGVDASGQQPLLSVVAVHCGGASAALELCDRLALQNLDPRSFELVLVDDGSSTPLAESFDSLSASFEIEIVRREPGDSSDAWALGVERARGRWSLLLREGTLPNGGTLRAHLIARASTDDSLASAGAVAGVEAQNPCTLATATNVVVSTELARVCAEDSTPAVIVRSSADATADGAAAQDRPVFLLGCAYRCGSTFLQRLLSSSPHLFVWGENMAISDLLADVIEREATWRWQSYQAAQWKDFEAQGLSAWIANLQPRPFPNSLRRALRAFYVDYYASETRRLGRERWGFKEVHHGARAARFLLDLFPAGRVVFVQRDPVDVLASVATTKWYDRVGRAPRVLKLWSDNVATIAGCADERVLSVRYEKLVAQPESELARIAEHIAVPTDRFDGALFERKVRGFDAAPQLGPDELAALRDSAFLSTARAAGYDVRARIAQANVQSAAAR